MRSSNLKLTSGFCLTILLLGTFTFGQEISPPKIYFVPDVIEQFNKLALRPDPLAFGLGDAPDPTITKHYQGIVRKHGPGTPYLFLSHSRNDTPECFGCSSDPGDLLIVRMGSRDTNGERLRSNRLVRDWDIAENLPAGENPWPTPPDPRDTTVAVVYFNGQYGWPNYGHPGGMQLLGDVLVVPLSHPYSGGPLNLILFLDVSNPETPVLLENQFAPEPGAPGTDCVRPYPDPGPSFECPPEFEAGQVALTPVLNSNGPGVRYIMLIAGKDNKEARLYRSLPTNQDGSTDLKAENLNWEFVRSWSGDELDDPGMDTWPCCGSQAHQMFNFVRQESLNGPLFLIGARNTEPVSYPGGGEDVLDLYQVHIDPYGNPADHLLSRIERKHVATNSIGGGGDASHFAGSTGVYVSPSGELIVYASQHNNEGPDELLPGGERGRPTVRFGEWRHREMVRPGSPTLKPAVTVGGPFEVDEGSTVALAAQGTGPITKAWLQLFEKVGLGLSEDFDGNNWVVADYEDWHKDNFDDFTKLLWFFNDKASSWRWFAPVGCTLRVNEHSFDDPNFLGGRHKTLSGTGIVEPEPDLGAVRDDAGNPSMDGMISSMRFCADCDAYYNASIGVAWDFDLNGVFEITGEHPIFSATELDGPSVRSVPVRAQHPTDETSLGHSAPVTVEIRVRNVPPNIASFALVDSLGLKVGIDVPFALVNLEYAAAGSFTDPGKPDHQTATLDLGNGTIVPSSGFDVFSDAFGGVTGQLRQHHSYVTPGTYAIRLEVTDDDGGLTVASRSVTVVSPSQALQSLVNQIDLLLSGTANPTVITALRDARNNLDGNPNGNPHNGARDELANGDFVAALVKIEAAIKALERAEAAGGGNLSGLKYLLGLTGESVAQGAYLNAVAAVGSPSPGQAAQLQRIRQAISDGHARLVNGDYIGAIDLFKNAVGRAVSLL
jgi:hypothetical protein